jgi:multiple sugar transport system substrate-binding protein
MGQWPGVRFLVFGLWLAGCHSNGAATVDGDDAPVTITFLRHDNPNYLTADDAYFEQYRADHPNVTIADTTVDFKALSTSLNSDLKNNQFAYDLVLIPPARLCSFADNLTDVPEDIITLGQARSTFFDAPLAGSVCNGGKNLKGLPVEYNLEYGGVVVNMDKYHARFPDKDPVWATWDDFLTEAAGLTEYDGNGKPMANGLDIDPGWSPPMRHIFISQIEQRGGHYLAPDGTFDFTSSYAHDSLAAMVDWVVSRRLMFSNLIPDKNTGVTTRLAAGTAGYGWGNVGMPLSVMGYAGSWAVPSTKGQVPPGVTWNFQYFPLPPMVGTEHKFVTDSGWSFAVPNTSRHQKVAWDVARRLALDPERMRQWSSVTQALPALRENGTVAAAGDNQSLLRVLPLLERGVFVGFVPAEGLDTINGAMVRGFFEAVKNRELGVDTVDQTLKTMQDTVNDVVATFGHP